MTHTRSLKGTKFFVKQNKLINGKCFQPFERIELIEPFERVENSQPLQPHKHHQLQKPLPTSSPTSSPQLNDERLQICR